MASLLDDRDPLMEVHRRVGHRLADTAYKEFGVEAEERHLFGLERLMYPQSDDMMRKLGATDDQCLHAKLIIAHALRARYVELCRSALAVAELKARS